MATYNLSETEEAIITRMRMQPDEVLDTLAKVEAGVIPNITRMKALARAVASQRIEHYLAAQVLAVQILAEPSEKELLRIDELETRLAIYAEELLSSNNELVEANEKLSETNQRLREINTQRNMEVELLEARV